ncbi:bifunctional phosphopantothenoylcysteine decarboxylase/phosphopantothenate--cysteine ligase CoaBC [Abyssisolibacter fermentans]|uniref:bifunctional phosphopantothenoylcysteine decarboxylase/phosphopantothenate--cysteine ligase CoaBC n=1 Tax=Abyssisolibacter fermentans TaxID=1766203 RepID=UPI000831F82F|nr:bifunctional phosphopantothenoylcysteine decarboxylase/phosphopantothenate--cysteine ligase CoaBC [Abyssisolibacter fermentans]
MLKGKDIVIGVTGGIAAYKAVDVVSKLIKLNANVDVIMTEAATKFVTPLTFQSLAHNPVVVDMFREPVSWDIEHIALAKKADIFLVVPATANIIGKIAHGIADDMLSTTIMASKAKKIIVPAMNTNMYKNVIVQENIEKLKSLDYKFINPISGKLACGDIGEGKLPDPQDIIDQILEIIKNDESNKDLLDKKVLVTAGATIAPLDPVRYLTNHSSGKMGYEIAKEAKRRGAKVILVSGHTTQNKIDGIETIYIDTTEEMLEQVKMHFDDADMVIKAAAPLDYRPKIVNDNKIKKEDGGLNVEFVKTPDILKTLGQMKKEQVLVGFAAETQELLKNAQKKLEQKNLDFIVANDVSKKGAGFKENTNIVTIIDKNGSKAYSIMEKSKIAKIIVDKACKYLK